MRFALAALALAAGITAAPGQDLVAYYISADEMVRSCRDYLALQRDNGQTSSPQVGWNSGICYGHVVGVLESRSWNGAPAPTPGLEDFCAPDGLNARDITEAVARWIDENPAARTGVGYSLVRRGLSASFPC